MNRFIYNPSKITGNRVLNKDLGLPKIRAEFYIRLFSFLNFEPEINDEGYEFYIKDTLSGLEFSAGLTGFGPGYFCKEEHDKSISIIEEFDKLVFKTDLELKDCKITFEHDFGRSIFGYIDGQIIELDEE